MTMLLEGSSASLADRVLRPYSAAPSTANEALLSQELSRRIPLPTLEAEIEVNIIGPEPNWLYPALNALVHLGQLETNWDSYGGRSIQPLAIVAALQFLYDLFLGDGPMPAVVPTSVGGVQLEWHRPDLDIEVEFGPTGQSSALLSDLVSGSQLEFDPMTPAAIPQIQALLFR